MRRLPMTRRAKNSRIRKRRPSYEGVIISNIERFASDQRVFGRKRRKQAHGGSVLIDVSGSMGIDQNDVQKIIRSAPSATLVAIYAGHSNCGYLRIVVKDGMMCDPNDLEFSCGANVVDVPSLDWLARQTPPRVWLSDGSVTGTNDQRSPEINAACEAIVQRHNIHHAASTEEVASHLESHR